MDSSLILVPKTPTHLNTLGQTLEQASTPSFSSLSSLSFSPSSLTYIPGVSFAQHWNIIDYTSEIRDRDSLSKTSTAANIGSMTHILWSCGPPIYLSIKFYKRQHDTRHMQWALILSFILFNLLDILFYLEALAHPSHQLIVTETFHAWAQQWY